MLSCPIGVKWFEEEFSRNKINKSRRLNNKKLLNKKQDKLYHLLTNILIFYVRNIRFYGYNATIDILLEK
jgi:hypothetical protein